MVGNYKSGVPPDNVEIPPGPGNKLSLTATLPKISSPSLATPSGKRKSEAKNKVVKDKPLIPLLKLRRNPRSKKGTDGSELFEVVNNDVHIPPSKKKLKMSEQVAPTKGGKQSCAKTPSKNSSSKMKNPSNILLMASGTVSSAESKAYRYTCQYCGEGFDVQCYCKDHENNKCSMRCQQERGKDEKSSHLPKISSPSLATPSGKRKSEAKNKDVKDKSRIPLLKLRRNPRSKKGTDGSEFEVVNDYVHSPSPKITTSSSTVALSSPSKKKLNNAPTKGGKQSCAKTPSKNSSSKMKNPSNTLLMASGTDDEMIDSPEASETEAKESCFKPLIDAEVITAKNGPTKRPYSCTTCEKRFTHVYYETQHSCKKPIGRPPKAAQTKDLSPVAGKENQKVAGRYRKRKLVKSSLPRPKTTSSPASVKKSRVAEARRKHHR